MITSQKDLRNASDLIENVCFKELKTYDDSRGFFRELIRDKDPFFNSGFAQWSHSKMAKNTVKAWHFHHKQTDWWYIPFGVVHVALIDNREDSPTYKNKIEFKLGEVDQDSEVVTSIVKIPPGVLHGCKVLSDLAHLFYITSEVYDPEDEGRLPFNSEKVDHCWGEESQLIVAENDKKTHIPKYERKK